MRNLLSGFVSGVCLVILWVMLTKPKDGKITISDGAWPFQVAKTSSTTILYG